jgi:tight adherence protein B
LGLVTAAALAAAFAAVAAGAPTGVTATPVARIRFPDRGFLISLPSTRLLSAGDISVHENGQLVTGLSVTPVSSAKESLGTVVVLDTSNSMHGRPLADALAAISRFAAQFSSGQEKIGLLTFNSKWRLVQPPSASADLTAALGQVSGTREGTHIYDALGAALDVVQKTKLAATSILLLSDGADTGSSLTSTALITRARRMQVRIFTVGLHSAAFDPVPLRRLANETGGTFGEATSSAALSPIFASLGHRLASEYLLRYRSQANPGAAVVVTLQIRGLGLSTLTYTSPKAGAVSPFHRSIMQRFWASIGSLVLVSLLVAALAGFVVAAALGRRPSNIGKRIAEFATLVSKKSKVEEKQLLSSRLLGGTERSLAQTQWWARFREELEIANIKLSAEQVLGLAVVGTLLVGLVLYSIAPVFSIFGLLVPMVVLGYCRRGLRKIRWAFESQLPDNLQVLASALRAGHSFVGALSVVSADAL